MKLTKQMLDAKLKQIAQFEQKYGECERSRAMKKYCTDAKYRERADAFQRSIAETIKNPNAYGFNNTLNENQNYGLSN